MENPSASTSVTAPIAEEKFRIHSSRWLFAAVFAGALLVRAMYLFEIKDAPVFSVLVSDGYYYDQMAQEIARGNWLGGDAFYQAPLYPYFLAAVYAVFGHDLLALRVVQFALGAAACVFVALAGRDFLSRNVGLTAGTLLALYAPAIFFDGLVQKAVLDLFLLSLLLMLLGRSWRDGRAGWLPAAGAALGLLALNRSNAIVLAAVVAVWIPVTFPRPRWARLGLFGVGLGVVLAAVGLRNQLVAGDFFLTAEQAGPHFFIGNNPNADGTYIAMERLGGTESRHDWTALAERATGRKLSPAEENAFWMERSLAFIREQPGRWLRLMGRKLWLCWNAPEIVDSEDPAVYADHSRWLRWLQPLSGFGLIAPLAVAGMAATWPNRRALWLLYFFLLVITATTALFFVSGRYRYPLVPVLMLFAAAGLVQLNAWRRARDWRNLGVAALVVAVAALVVNWRLTRPAQSRAVTYHNLGVTLAERGQIADAIGYYHRALELEPDFVPARVNLAISLAAIGQTNQAIAQLDGVLRSHPNNTVAQRALAHLTGKSAGVEP